MQLTPDSGQATVEQQGITRIVRSVLTRAGFSDIDAHLLSHPGLIAVVKEIQRLPPDATAAQDAAAAHDVAVAVRAALAEAETSTRRARRLDCPVWQTDLAAARPHLCAGLDRALAQLPARPDRVIDVRVAEWTKAEREVFCAAAALLDESWPEMLAELAVCVRQVALLRGYGITGFSDFAVHGAIFINAERFEFRDGLPGTLRLAENLVHEGAHTRCYSAAVARPFLGADPTGDRVVTPLRADPRPLSGLFQQLVVLCRCAELYSRVPADTASHPAVRARIIVLVTQARQALATLHGHAEKLTDHGRAILRDAAAAICARAAAVQ